MPTALTHVHAQGYVATRYGLEESIFLDSIMFWWRSNRGDNRNFRDGYWWTYNSLATYVQMFPWWSEKQIRRIINSCKDQGALLTGNYNDDRRDRTVWYTPSDELLALYGEPVSGDCNCPNGQMQTPERAEEDAQMGGPLPCIDHVYNYPPYNPPTGDGVSENEKPQKRRSKSVPDWKPERFDAFWTFYPRGEDRVGAVREWDRLKPSDELIATMGKALKRQMATEEWQRGVGIPYACRWLKNRRWEDEIALPVKQEVGGWADDPEVY